jgi:hypothetical protein
MMHKRPFLVTMLAVSVLMFTFYNAVRFATALRQWDWLMIRMPTPGAAYIAATGLFWALVLLAVTLNLWLGWKWVRPTTALSLALYMSYYWLDRLFFSALPRENWLFALGVTILYTLFTALALNLPGSQKFFQRKKRVL